MTILDLEKLFGPGKKYTYASIGNRKENAPRDFHRIIDQLKTAEARLQRVGIKIKFEHDHELHQRPPHQPDPDSGGLDTDQPHPHTGADETAP